MKIYKYRSLSLPDNVAMERLKANVQRRTFWCARPDTLNDPEEFGWVCDFSPSLRTAEILAQLLVDVNGRGWDEARVRVANVIGSGRLRDIAEPVVAEVIRQSRNEIGLSCFGMSPDNDTLWDRYAGAGAGVCVEVEVPDGLVGSQLRLVNYSDAKRIHIDQFITARLGRQQAELIYDVTLLSKSRSWESESEIRFVSKMQNLNVMIDGSVITRVIAGRSLTPRTVDQVRAIAGSIPVETQEFSGRPKIALQSTAVGDATARRG